MALLHQVFITTCYFVGLLAIQCHPNLPTADLAFVDPLQENNTEYPPTWRHQYIQLNNPPLDVYCCATGFSNITWSLNGVEFERTPPPGANYEYDDNNQIFWLKYKDIETGYYNFTCLVYSTDRISTIEHTTHVHFIERVRPATPVFVDPLPEDQCKEVGDSLVFSCSISDKRPFLRDIYKVVITEAGNPRGIVTNSLEYPGVTNITNIIPTSPEWIRRVTITVSNVTESWLDKSYTCFSHIYPGLKKYFNITSGPCKALNYIATTPEPEEQLSELAITLGVMMGLLLVVLLVVVIFRMELKMWYHVNIVQRSSCCISDKASFENDVYLIYPDVEHPIVSLTIKSLENDYTLRLHIPDRDFTIGALTPDSLSRGMKSSRYVVAFVTSSMFSSKPSKDAKTSSPSPSLSQRGDEEADTWSDLSISLAISLHKPLLIVLLENLKPHILKQRKDLRTALKIVDVVQHTDTNLNERMEKFLHMKPSPQSQYSTTLQMN